MALFTGRAGGTTEATQETTDTTSRVTGTTSTPYYGAQSPPGAGNETAPTAYLNPLQQLQSQSLTQQVANNGSSSVFFAQLATMYGFSFNDISAVKNSPDNSLVIITFKDGSVKSYPNPAYVKPVDPSAFVPQAGGAKSTEPATRNLSELTFVSNIGWVDKYGVAYTYHDDDGKYYLDQLNNTGYAALPDTPVQGIANGPWSTTPFNNLVNLVTGKPLVTPTTQAIKTVDNGSGVMQPMLVQNYSDGSYQIIGTASAQASATANTPTEVSQPPTLAQNIAAESFAQYQQNGVYHYVQQADGYWYGYDSSGRLQDTETRNPATMVASNRVKLQPDGSVLIYGWPLFKITPPAVW